MCIRDRDEIPEKELEQTKNAVLKYSAISVREDSAVKLIKKLGYESVQQVLDPTLGLSLEDWKPLIAPDAVSYTHLFPMER